MSKNDSIFGTAWEPGQKRKGRPPEVPKICSIPDCGLVAWYIAPKNKFFCRQHRAEALVACQKRLNIEGLVHKVKMYSSRDK